MPPVTFTLDYTHTPPTLMAYWTDGADTGGITVEGVDLEELKVNLLAAVDTHFGKDQPTAVNLRCALCGVVVRLK